MSASAGRASCHYRGAVADCIVVELDCGAVGISDRDQAAKVVVGKCHEVLRLSGVGRTAAELHAVHVWVSAVMGLIVLSLIAL